MRYLILSDVHANIDALESVLAAAPAASWDRAVVLGDLVGYGAEPNAVIERLRGLDPLLVIRGNHDKAACGIDDGRSFNVVARTAALWTMAALTPANLAYLRELPAGPAAVDDFVEICHGAPFDEDHYIFDEGDAARALDTSTRRVCLFGHTHLPAVFEDRVDGTGEVRGMAPADDSVVSFQEGRRYLVNPGSVGQPRDGDPRAAFGVYDAGQQTLRLRRIFYPVAEAQRRIREAGLHPSLAARLAIGR